jgi:hypothetical protein
VRARAPLCRSIKHSDQHKYARHRHGDPKCSRNPKLNIIGHFNIHADAERELDCNQLVDVHPRIRHCDGVVHRHKILDGDGDAVCNGNEVVLSLIHI